MARFDEGKYRLEMKKRDLEIELEAKKEILVEWNEKISRLETENKRLRKENEKLNTENQSLQNTVSSLQDEIVDLTTGPIEE